VSSSFVPVEFAAKLKFENHFKGLSHCHDQKVTLVPVTSFYSKEQRFVIKNWGNSLNP